MEFFFLCSFQIKIMHTEKNIHIAFNISTSNKENLIHVYKELHRSKNHRPLFAIKIASIVSDDIGFANLKLPRNFACI